MREDHWQGDWFQSYDVIPFLSIERLAAYVKRYEEFLKWPIMQPLVRHVTSSELWKYEVDILQSVGPFVGNCRTSPHAPEIVALTKTIFNQDMLTVLLVNYGYFLLEAQANTFNDTMVGVVVNVALTFLSASLLLLTVPYSIQFFLHKTALLLKLPETFRLMSRDRQVISNAVCANCNVLRYNKGLFRDIVNFLFQQLLLFSIRSMPKLVSPAGSLAISWLSMSAYPLEWLFTGQLLFGYPLFAAGLCQREVLINLQQYPELYIAMGQLIM